jgi:hypothetical protein
MGLILLEKLSDRVHKLYLDWRIVMVVVMVVVVMMVATLAMLFRWYNGQYFVKLK